MDPDELWREALAGRVPASVAAAADALITKADALVRANTLPADFDVVVAGAGFCSLYFVGVHAVLSRAGAAPARYAGASSGAMTPMELLVLGERRLLELYLANGAIYDEHPANVVSLACRADRFWWALSETLFAEERAPAFDSGGDANRKCLVGARGKSSTGESTRPSRGSRGPRPASRDAPARRRPTRRRSGPANVVYSAYPTLEFAKRVFMSTGTALTSLEGYYVTDGGVTNGCPLFEDAKRPQLVVRPMKSGLPTSMAVGYGLAQGVAAVELGMADAAAFLEGRAGRARDAPSRSESGSLELLARAAALPG